MWFNMSRLTFPWRQATWRTADPVCFCLAYGRRRKCPDRVYALTFFRFDWRLFFPSSSAPFSLRTLRWPKLFATSNLLVTQLNTKNLALFSASKLTEICSQIYVAGQNQLSALPVISRLAKQPNLDEGHRSPLLATSTIRWLAHRLKIKKYFGSWSF